MTWKRITLDGMKWWVPCRTSEEHRCFTRERAIQFESVADAKAHNPEVLS